MGPKVGRARSWLRRHRALLIVSVAIAVLDGVFVAANVRFSRDALMASIQEEFEGVKTSYGLALDQVYANLVLIATYVANDKPVREAFFAGRSAVLDEGGKAGGPEADRHRQRLLSHLEDSWSNVQAQFATRQLHFHIGPGSLSFLRVHRPEKFGDRMDDVRHTIVDAIAEGRVVTAFETGRVYSGLRGVVPLFPDRVEPGPGRAVGAVEVGTSFDHLLGLLDSRYDMGAGVLLNQNHVNAAMWQAMLEEQFAFDIAGCDCVIEASSRDSFPHIVRAAVAQGISLRTEGVSLLGLDGRTLAVSHLPLLDHQAESAGRDEAIGAVVFWRDVTDLMDEQARTVAFNIIYALIAFIVVEALLILGFHLATRHLAREIRRKTTDLERSNRDLEGFAHSISHDLKNPLSAVTVSLGLMQSLHGQAMPAKASEYLGYALDGANRMARMIDGLLRFSRLTREDVAFERLETRAVVNDALADLRGEIDRTGADIRVPETLPSVVGDGSQIERVFLNLIGNAIKYGRPGVTPVVTVTAERDGPLVAFTVADNGLGMPPESLSRIFDIFHRVDHASAVEGSGIGLAMVKRIIEQHGGTITVSSELGVGSRFRITLPTHDPHGRAGTRRPD